MNREELLKIAKPILFNTNMTIAILDDRKTVTRRNVVKPKYKVGDILYVREKFNDIETDTILYAADKDFIEYGCKEVDEYLFMESDIKWKPSIHMPKEAARIFLKVTGVRVERLQDITEEQAIKEGCIDTRGFIHSYDNEYSNSHSALKAFIELWNGTIKKQDLDKYGWEANPWVWVIKFERIRIEQ
ncbi:hypothetical protein [Sedimentibacter sp.]|uniref:hypothetical protein n=1 Tax=Sedimentibacter sp. TaxID=1960295 RepID=UPI0028B0AE8E|nr:hypothetical protein [Sedimentibacter sp.]